MPSWHPPLTIAAAGIAGLAASSIAVTLSINTAPGLRRLKPSTRRSLKNEYGMLVVEQHALIDRLEHMEAVDARRQRELESVLMNSDDLTKCLFVAKTWLLDEWMVHQFNQIARDGMQLHQKMDVLVRKTARKGYEMKVVGDRMTFVKVGKAVTPGGKS